MAVHETLTSLAGEWSGTNKLHMPWMPEPLHESPSTASVRERVGGQCLEIEYTWSYEGNPHTGVLILCGSGGSNGMNAVWTDSWHSANVLMTCRGSVDASGNVSLKGSYAVPDHPDWGWRTDIIPGNAGFEYVMYNVSPDGVEELAVETRFTRPAR